MKNIALPHIHAGLRDMRHEIVIAPAVIARARASLDRMLAVGRRERV